MQHLLSVNLVKIKFFTSTGVSLFNIFIKYDKEADVARANDRDCFRVPPGPIDKGDCIRVDCVFGSIVVGVDVVVVVVGSDSMVKVKHTNTKNTLPKYMKMR